MTEEQRLISLQTNKLKLSFWNKFTHFEIVGFLIFIPLLFVFFHLRDLFNGNPKSIKEAEIPISIISVLLALLFFKIQANRLKFKIVKTSLSRENINEIIEKVGKQLKWQPEKINDKYFIAKTNPSFFSGSWGEQITILFDNNRILINSICDLDKRSSIVSMGRNRKNENRLIEEIEKASH